MRAHARDGVDTTTTTKVIGVDNDVALEVVLCESDQCFCDGDV